MFVSIRFQLLKALGSFVQEVIGSGEAGEEALCVRAFGITYMTLGISIRFA